MLKAKCMRCGKIHPEYEFKPEQLCYVLWCDNCGTQMHESVEGGLTPLAGDGGELWACPKCSHENDAMAIKCYFCDAAAPKA